MLAPLRIIAGLHNFAISSGREQIRSAPNVMLHPNYVGGVAPFDIALLRLDSPLNFVDDVIERIRLPPPGVIPSGNVQLFGWGSTSMTNIPFIPDVLQTATKDLLSLDICREVLRSRYPLQGSAIHSTNLCTGPLDTTVTACTGDSGSPIVQESDDGVVIVGVASWISEFPCGAINAVSVYVRASAFIDWIFAWTGPL